MAFDRELLMVNKKLKSTVSPQRYQHSIRVMKKALEYAKIYNIDNSVVKITALAHDIAREMTKEESYRYIKDNKLPQYLLDEENYPLIHGAIGADICKKNYLFTEDMSNAIRYHTTGRKNMSILEKIIYLADKNEDGRNYPSVYNQRELALKSLNNAMILTLKNSIHFTIQKHNTVNNYSLEALHFLQKTEE